MVIDEQQIPFGDIELSISDVFVYPLLDDNFALYFDGIDQWGIFEAELAFEDSDKWVLQEGDYSYFDNESELELENFCLTKEGFEQAKEKLLEMIEAFQVQGEQVQ